MNIGKKKETEDDTSRHGMSDLVRQYWYQYLVGYQCIITLARQWGGTRPEEEAAGRSITVRWRPRGAGQPTDVVVVGQVQPEASPHPYLRG